jgi:hypothetical protein
MPFNTDWVSLALNPIWLRAALGLFGTERKGNQNRLMNNECNKRYAAYHEAGHFVVAHKFGEAEYAELLDEEENCGKTKYKHTLEDIDKKEGVLILLAGPISELKYRRKLQEKVTIEDTQSNDFYRAKQVLGWNAIFDSDAKYAIQLRSHEQEAEKEIENRWNLIVNVANRLMKKGKVTLEDMTDLA